MLKQIEREELRRKLAPIIPPVLVEALPESTGRLAPARARDTSARRGGHAPRPRCSADKSAESSSYCRAMPKILTIGRDRCAALTLRGRRVAIPAASRTGWKPDFPWTAARLARVVTSLRSEGREGRL